ncbi:plasmid mobilization protein [Piscirickettsia salmonis]
MQVRYKRVIVLMNKNKKEVIKKSANRAGLSVGHFMRQSSLEKTKKND